MKITGRVENDGVVDVVCDVCRSSTRADSGVHQFGTLQAHWGYGSAHDGQRYELHLCEECFFRILACLKQERRTQNLFTEDSQDLNEDFGMIASEDFFSDAGSR